MAEEEKGEEEKKSIFEADDVEEGDIAKVYEMRLEKRSRFLRLWEEYTVKINQETHSIYIEDEPDFQRSVGLTELPLNKCTISLVTVKGNKQRPMIQELILKFKDGKKSLKRHFKLPNSAILDDEAYAQESQKFILFSATLIHEGSQFDKLKELLENWRDHNSANNKLSHLSKPELMEIFRIKYNYDLYMQQHSMIKYVAMIQNMNDQMIEPLKALLEIKTFRKNHPEQWQERCESALRIEIEWKLLLQRIRSQISNISTRLKLSGALESNVYDKIRQYEAIQQQLAKLCDEMQVFVTAFIIQELKEWEKLRIHYKDEDETWKWVLPLIVAGLCAAGCVVCFALCPAIGAGTAVAASSAATAATTATTTTTAWTGGAIALAVGGGVSGAASVVSAGLSLYNYRTQPHFWRMRGETESVNELWENFKDTYVGIQNNVQRIKDKEIVPRGPGWDANSLSIAASCIVRESIQEFEKMCRECFEKIEQCE